MKKTRRRYTREFKVKALRLLETSGKSTPQIEHDLGIGKGNLCRWKQQMAKMHFRVKGSSHPIKSASDRWSERLKSCVRNGTY